jgi:hypothetical protein
LDLREPEIARHRTALFCAFPASDGQTNRPFAKGRKAGFSGVSLHGVAQTIVKLLNHFEPSLDGLLRDLSAHVDDPVLDWIARADYGLRAEEHLVALRQLRDTGTFPHDLTWCPMEVLELTRWHEPEQHEQPSRIIFEHGARAFSCAAILRAEQEPYRYLYNNGCTCSTVIQLIWSLRSIPGDFSSQAASHFAWLMLHSDPEGKNDQVRVYGVALLWFALQIPAVPDTTLISLIKWVTQRADELTQRPTDGGPSGLREMVMNCQEASAWELLGCEICNLNLSHRSSDLQVWAKLVGEQLVG